MWNSSSETQRKRARTRNKSSLCISSILLYMKAWNGVWRAGSFRAKLFAASRLFVYSRTQ